MTPTPPATALPDRHLDLGCGKRPRNPYHRATLCGTDVRALQADDLPDPAIDYRVANVVLDPIPWPANHFGSVSAFDFIEHVPRLLMTPDGHGTVFPFVRLMDEVWRVLAPGGCFYALTPAYPSPQAFQDPTHVNIITDQTHTYFCGERPLGRIYGFSGHFEVLRVGWVEQSTHFTAIPSAPPVRQDRPVTLPRRIAHAVRDGLRKLRGRPAGTPPPPVYLLWEWRAIKPAQS
jgi:SAM-dependent methyltransferase